MTPYTIIAVFALSWELVSAGALDIIDPRGYRAVYQAAWWVSCAALAIAGAATAVAGTTWIQVLAGALSTACAGACFRFPFPKAEKRKITDPRPVRHATDSNRRRRMPLLLISAALVVAASLAVS